MNIRNFTPRVYQANILNTCKDKNTLVCIPTGLGKTKCAILLAVFQLNKYQNTKVMVLTPTKPLANQICNEFKECTDIEESKIILLTGAIPPKKRQELYKNAVVIVATPQTINEDLQNQRITLENFSLLTIDECHRSRQNFANTKVAKIYIGQNPSGKIIALTASPGSTKAKIEEICENLFIDAVEIRTEKDEDVVDYIQAKEIEYLNVDLPEEMRYVHLLIKNFYKDKLKGIENFNISKPASSINKVDLLLLQKRLQFSKKTPATFYGLSLTALLLKLNFAMEMIETQGLKSLNEFLEKLEKEETRAAKTINKNSDIIRAKNLCRQLIEKGLDHPKINKLIEIVKEETNKKSNSKIIIFANYRNTVDNLVKTLEKENIKAVKLVGQKEGLSQKKQIEVIDNFSAGKYNCLVATSIAEEGIHISEAEMAVFYDNTPSSIRKIQRVGRVGRLKPGKVIFMITKGTRDQAYYWKSQQDENRMKGILTKMKDNPFQRQKILPEF